MECSLGEIFRMNRHDGAAFRYGMLENKMAPAGALEPEAVPFEQRYELARREYPRHEPKSVTSSVAEPRYFRGAIQQD